MPEQIQYKIPRQKWKAGPSVLVVANIEWFIHGNPILFAGKIKTVLLKAGWIPTPPHGPFDCVSRRNNKKLTIKKMIYARRENFMKSGAADVNVEGMQLQE